MTKSCKLQVAGCWLTETNLQPATCNLKGPAGRLKARLRVSGFSLVEILCAVLILGIALTGLVQGVTTGLSSSKESELQTVAALFAAGQMETVRAEGDL